MDAHQLREDRADVLAARRQFDPQNLLNHMMPGHLVGHGRNVVHAIDDGDVLVVIEVLAELLEAAVQVADVRHGIDNRLAVECENQAQGGVRGRMLRTEIQRPKIFFVRRVG